MVTQSADFSSRHIGPRTDDITFMAQAVGYESLDALIDAAVPERIRTHEYLKIPHARSEASVQAALRTMAQLNVPMVQMIGLGYYDTVTPAVIRRGVVESAGWYTSYTPYQPEISQGRLEALLNFQTMVSDLTGLPIAGASLLDEATAVAEAVALMRRSVRRKPDGVIFIDDQCFPQTLAVARSRARSAGISLVPFSTVTGLPPDIVPDTIVGVVLQQPGRDGQLREFGPLVDLVHEHGGLVAMAADILSLVMLKSPGDMGADIAVGSTQRFGVPLYFGGPHAAYMAVRQGLERDLPGRLVGVSKDSTGKPALRLALQTREQHIRREKATSNICTAQALLAVVASMYAVYHGPEGLSRIATQVNDAARSLAAALLRGGFSLVHDQFFDTVTVSAPGKASEIVSRAAGHGINLRRIGDDMVAVACDEKTRREHLTKVLLSFGVEASVAPDLMTAEIPQQLRRTTTFLTHPVFHRYRSETAMMRYLRKLEDRDIALDRSMIPLGSCTMKLNSAIEMEPISWPGFAGIHPFAPENQTRGYHALIESLSDSLAEITGYDAVSVQPNSGAQGEYAGLLAIRNYHRSRNDHARDICLIPASAHGTNAASAVLAGLHVKVVATQSDGTIDTGDLATILAHEGSRIAAIMITYPSTHGVYEESVVDVCDAVHAVGGQVYLDGANLNALVGLAKPGKFGGDVSHLNLHKTFAIPHGGGGPGIGPIGVGAHLAPFLPVDPQSSDDTGDSVSATMFGSAGVLPITWAYVALMGPDGLRHASEVAVLNANYVAHRLGEHFPVLYTGAHGLVAHECIIDVRGITKESGVTVDDVAKRLIDFGFHAPTMSFPVAGTLMVEPTESESRGELDRFCDAMIAIRAEIRDVEEGRIDVEDSPLRHAPHTAETVVANEWNRRYPREHGAFPGVVEPADKYWPPVGRIDGAFGDRNLVCSCPPIEAYEDNQR